MENLLEIRSLRCGYNGNEVIRNISFSVKERDFLGIIGPNGAGKTTIFKALTKILKPTKGEILYKGKNILEFSGKELFSEIAVLSQFLEISFSFTVEEFVSLGRFPHLNRFETPKKYDLEIIEEAMNLVKVAHLRKRQINQLSGGERQRALFAQALAQEPKLLLLDEPVSHLDIKHQVEILDLLKKLNRQGLTLILILHDLNLASEYCDRLILLNEGEIRKEGSPQEVLDYKIIEEVYKTVVVIHENPISKKPYIFLVSEEAREKK